MNMPLDCYSKSPVDKITLLNVLQQEFSLKYEISSENSVLNATGNKMNYYSINKLALQLAYMPSFSSIETVRCELLPLISEKGY